MNRDDQPPPMPPRPPLRPSGVQTPGNLPPGHAVQRHSGDDATQLQHGVMDDDLEPGQDHALGGGTMADTLDPEDLDLPDALPEDLPPLQGGTGAKVTLRALDESFPGRENTHERTLRQQHNLERRQPVESRKRPTLMPSGMDGPPLLPGARREADPALMRPVRPLETARPGQPREASDVIQMFSAGSSGAAAMPAPMQKQRTVPPPPQQPQPGRLLRRAPPQPGHATVPPPQPQVPQPTNRAQPLASPAWLPLNADRLAIAIADHRARQQTLDLYARALEIGAGLFGTVSLVVLIATLVSILLGHGQSMVLAGSAIVGSLGGLAVTGLMVALALGLRQLALHGAQLAALLEALSQPPR
jgi:hypothetical protein